MLRGLLLLTIGAFAVGTLQARETVSGCLAPDKEVGSWLLVREGQYALRLSGALNLDSYIGQRVKLEGDFRDGQNVFAATKVIGSSGDCDGRADQATADDQAMDRSDMLITSKIRQAIVADDKLSTLAQNVKIITRSGVVVLRGPVRSTEEKERVEAVANTVAGAANVRSDLTIATNAGR